MMQVGAVTGGAFVQTYPTGVTIYPSTIPMSNNFGTYPPSYNAANYNMGPPSYPVATNQSLFATNAAYSSQPFAANNNLNKF